MIVGGSGPEDSWSSSHGNEHASVTLKIIENCFKHFNKLQPDDCTHKSDYESMDINKLN